MSEELNNTQGTPEEEHYDGILGDYEENAAAEETPAEEAAPAKPPKKKNKKGAAIAGILVAVLALGGLGTYGVMKYRETMPKTAASTDHQKITDRMAAVYLRDTVDMYKDYYGEEGLKSYFGLDLNMSLKSQQYQGDENTTWFDSLIEEVENNTKQYLVLKEAGEAMGHQITDTDQEIITDRLEKADYDAYGNRVTEKDLREALEMQAFGAGVYKKVREGFTFTDEEIENYIKENGSSYVTCGLMGFNLSFGTDTDDESTDSEDEEKDDTEIDKSTAATLARKLRACKTKKQFEDQVLEILTEYKGYSEEDAKAQVLPSIVNDSFGYSTGNQLGDWAFGGEAKVGDTLLVENEDAFYVYLMTREPERDQSPTINVRHILFSTSEHLEAADPENPTDEENAAALAKCHELAEKTLEDWKNGEATEDSFGKLASELTDDPGSKENGGLYENVTEGQMVTTFNDWCFDKSRKPGDTGIVETSYGVHVMYFVSTGDPMWKIEVETNLRAQKFEEWYKAQENLYTVTLNEDVFNSIDG